MKQVLIESCLNCPFRRLHAFDHCVNLGGPDLEEDKLDEIHKDCPLSDYKETKGR
jgi:hypothetical protein